jgi:hypothetical protein
MQSRTNCQRIHGHRTKADLNIHYESPLIGLPHHTLTYLALAHPSSAICMTEIDTYVVVLI